MTATDDYTTHVHLGISPDRVFEILTTVAEFASWWAPATGSATEGGEVRITFHGFEDPLVLRVKQATRPSKVIWDIESCSFLPDWVGTTPTFTPSEPGTGGCDLLFQHVGLSPQLNCYDMRRAGWDQYLPGLRDHIDTGTGNPYSRARLS